MLDLIKPPDIWLPSGPAIVRALAVDVPKFDFRQIDRSQFPAPCFCPRRAMKSIAYQNDVGAVATSVTFPTVQKGDFAIVFVRSTSTGSAVVASTPSGFTLIKYEDTLSTHRGLIAYRICDGSEGGTTVSGGQNGSSNHTHLFIFRPDFPFASLSIGSLNSEATGGDPALQTIAASAGTAPSVIVFGYAIGRDGAPTRSGTLHTTGTTWTGTGSATVFGAYRIFNSSPIDLTYDANDSGLATALISFYVQFNP